MDYVKESTEDVKHHAARHRQVAKGAWPKNIRDFIKDFGFAVAHNDGGLARLQGKYDAETGKLAVAFSWWGRALSNGAPLKDFDAYMNAHLKLAEASVSGSGEVEARKLIAKWSRYDG